MHSERSDSEQERYSRQLDPDAFGEEGQARLRGSRALVVGMGALGTLTAAQLVAAGVGHVGVVDPEEVSLSGLHRQLLHYTPDLGRNKAENAAAKLGFLNPEVQVDAYPARLDEENAEALATGYDVVVDCANEVVTSVAAARACSALGIPLVSGAVHGRSGWAATLRAGETACLRCTVEALGAGGLEEEGRGVALGPIAGVVASLQSLQALELLSGSGKAPPGRAVRADGAAESVREVEVERRADCSDCAGTPGRVGATL